MTTCNIKAAIVWATESIDSVSDTARLDAEVLLAHVLQKPRSYLFSWPDQFLDAQQKLQFEELVNQRLMPTPVAYLTGEREFYSLDFEVTPSVLVPRPETELLVEKALQVCQQRQPRKIIDLGTGSGIIAVTVKKHFPLAEMWATDADPQCLEVAARNARHHGVDIHFRQSPWFDEIPETMDFDLILSNPPYIAGDHPFLQRGDLPAEPNLALTPGASGLESLQVIVAGARHYLRRGGSIILEHGYDQQRPVHDLLVNHGFTAIECFDDFNAHPRVSLAVLENQVLRTKKRSVGKPTDLMS